MSLSEGAYGLEQDDDPTSYSESVVVNVTDEDVVFRIAQTPGVKPRRYTLARHGRPGDRVSIQTGYTQPYKGAGRGMVDPIIDRLTMRHVFHDGPRLPMVVHEEKAAEYRAKWVAALQAKASKDSSKPVTIAVQVDAVTRAPISAKVKPAPEPEFIGEEVGQDEIEPPHPDDVEDEPIADGPPAKVKA